ncbi:alanine--glyoxylate aminotransferase 2, mitochondrial [Leptinotarsa decemlineata]|uniref:alanine--glyoxylate aminotransferase 2, mitochondrial n=1 Tax=Leptinotarsa decemlineata TaxID=7539 RepID=UPI003D304A74
MKKGLQCVRKFTTKPQLPECDFTPKPYKGLSYDEITQIRKKNLNPALTTYYSKPLALHQGYKQWLFDIHGRRYLDMFAGVCTVSVGHCHPRITKAVTEQMEILGHSTNIYYHTKVHEYAKKLADSLPGDLKCIYFVNSGSEANDLALLMARSYTGRSDVVSLKNCYHGMTYQTMGLTCNNYYKYPVPGAAGMYKTHNPDVYNGIWGGNKCRDSPIQTDRPCSCSGACEAGLKYVDQFVEELNFNIPKNGLAAFWAESIQGVGGAVQYPKNYIKSVYDIVKKHGGLFVSDEVQTGFGRTGDHFWGFESHGIVPDIVTMAKGIGNGYPLAAVVTTEAIASGLSKAGHFNTYGGNPVACTIGLTVLDIIQEEQLQKNCKDVGTYMLLALAKLKSEYSIIGDVRGKGLMIGVELVQDRETRKPLKASDFMKIWEHTRDLGLIIGKGGLHGNVIRIKPPMCVTKEDVDFTLEVLASAFDSVK